MSYEDTNCPCGGKKPTDTMLCDDCNHYLKDRREMREFQDGALDLEYRRHAAIILVTLARSRKREQAKRVPVMSVVLMLALLFLVGCGCQSERGFPPEHQIRNFDHVTDRVWRGAQPNAEGFRWLLDHKCKVVVNLQAKYEGLPNELELVSREPAPGTNGMAYYAVPMSGTHAPTQVQIKAALAIIDGEIADGHWPVFIHCEHGCDRTGIVIACWRIKHGWSNADALREAEEYGLSKWEFGMRRFIKHFR